VNVVSTRSGRAGPIRDLYQTEGLFCKMSGVLWHVEASPRATCRAAERPPRLESLSCEEKGGVFHFPDL
jgi:hypothetical protein